jgi:hypothetical protein
MHMHDQAQGANMKLVSNFGFGGLRQLCAGLIWVWLAACGSDGGSDSTTPPVAPSISAQPASASAVAGNSVSFSVNASGDGLAIQWQRSADSVGTSWINVAGATAATYSIAAVDASLNNIQFRAVITGSAGTLTSSAATLTVTTAASPPVVTLSPANQTVVVGASASFSVTASGTALQYQWQSSPDGNLWTAIVGATSTTLNLQSAVLADSGKRFRAVISSGSQSVNSEPATLTVNAAASGAQITAQPQSVSVIAPQVATFVVAAVGNPAPSYQWQQSSDGGITFTDITLATNASYSTPATSVGDSGKQLRVRVGNDLASVTSASVTLTVTAITVAPIINTQPANQTVTAPATATFSVVASGTPTPSYQWQISTDGGVTFVNINGATTNSYTTLATVAADSGKRFRVIVSNVAGSVNSNSAALTVNISGGGGGGGGGGNVLTTCASPFALPTGTFVETVSTLATSPTPLTTTSRVVGPANFQGNTAIQIDVASGGLLPLTGSLFGTFNIPTGTATAFGGTSRYGTPGDATVQDNLNVATPPALDARYALAPGQTLTQSSTYVNTTVVTTNGVAGPPTTKTDTTTFTVTFVGMEVLTVPAGTFNTCKYIETRAGSTSPTTKWELVGYGGSVKSVTGTSTTTLTSIKVNGTPLTRFP